MGNRRRRDGCLAYFNNDIHGLRRRRVRPCGRWRGRRVYFIQATASAGMRYAGMKPFAILLAPLALASCTVFPPHSAPPMPHGAAVALRQSVRVGELIVTPVAWSRQPRPINARCIWAGRLVVRTLIDGQAGGERWSDRAELRLGEAYATLAK